MSRLALLLLAFFACCIAVFAARDSWNHVGVVNEISSNSELSLNDQSALLNNKDLQNAANELLNYNIFHILQESGSTGPSPQEDFIPVVVVLDLDVIDCPNDPIPVNITLSISPENFTSIVDTVSATLSLVCPSDSNSCDADAIGSFTVVELGGLTVIGNPSQTHLITLEGTLADMIAALASVIYFPPSHNSNIDIETMADFLVEVSVLVPLINTPGLDAARFIIRQPANVPYVYPIDVQSFNNLSATVNSTVIIPPIHVSDLVDANDLLYVSIDPTNTGRIFVNSTANLTFVPVNPLFPQVVAFVGHLDAVNDALANILFTPTNCTGAYCIHRYGFFVLVKDLANTSICPDVAVILCELEINANEFSTIYAALPAPTLVSVTNDSVTITFRSTPLNYNFPPNTPPPTGYAISWSIDPNTHGYANFIPNPARAAGVNQTYTSPAVLPSGTTISLIVGMINDAGLSTLSSPPLVFTTESTAAPPVSGLRVLGFTSSSITFAFNPSESPDITGYIAGVNTSSSDVVIIPVSNEEVVYVLRGLSSFTPYKISVASRNVYGVSPKSEVTQWTKLQGPQIVGFVASDPDNEDNILDNGDQITISFNIDTNRPAASTKAEIDTLFSFTQVLGAGYIGEWVNARTLVITLTDVTGSTIRLGVLRATVVAALYDANQITDASTSSSPLLAGNWGTAGMLSYFVAPSTALIISENEESYLGVTGDNSVLSTNTTYTLSVEILSPQYISSRLSGRVGNWSEPGMIVSVSGNSANLSNALSSVLFTSPRQYAGPVSFQFSLLDGTNIVAVMVFGLSITSVNHAPVLIQPERVPAYLNTWSSVSVDGNFIALNDVDVAIDSTTDVQTITISASHTGLLRFVGSAQVGVKYSPDHGESARTMQLSGSLYALNYALSTLEVNFEFETSSLAFPADYFIALQFNDNANGGLPALTTYGIVHFDLHCPSSMSTVLPTNIESISFSSSGNQLQVTFTRPASASVLVSPSFDCGSVFTSQSIALFGASPSCRWSNTRTIEVTLGLNTVVLVNSPISIRSNSIPRCPNGEPTTGPRSALVSVGVGSSAPVAPAVSISGPEWASSCRSLTLTGEVFQSSSHDLTYSWGVPSFFNSEYANIQPVAPSSLSTSFLIINSSAFTKFANPPSSYEFTLTVTDFLGQMDQASYEVSVDRDIKPFITPISQAYTRIYRDEQLSLFTRADLPNCGAISSSVDRRISYSWTVSPSIDGYDLPAASNVFVPANILSYHASADHRYVFTLRAAMASNPSLYTEQHFVVEVLLNGLKPRISGGDVRTIKSISALTVDASDSYDVDASPSASSADYQFSWTCVQLASFSSSSAGCYDVNGSPLDLPQTSTLSFPAGHLVPNDYVFTVRWWHSSSHRMGTASQKVRVVEFDTPADISVDTPKLIVNSNDRVAVRSTADGPTNFTLTWTTSTSAAVQSVSFVSSSNNLFINNDRAPNFFQPGATYQATAVSTDIDGLVTSSSVAFYVNRPPICSQLSLSPSSGVALTSEFSFLVASGDCYDPDGDATDVINFQYFRMESGRQIFLTPSNPSNLLEHITLPAGLSVVVGVRISDRFGAYSELTTSVSVSSQTANTLESLIDLYNSVVQVPISRGDATMVLNAINNILTTARSVSPALSAADMTTLKDHVLSDLFSQASALPDSLILQSLTLIFADVNSVSTSAVMTTLDYINSINVDTTYVPSLLNSISQFIAAGSSSGSGRRLLSVLDSATLTSLINNYIQAVNSVLADYSMNYLTYNGDIYQFSQSLLQGAIYRAVAPITSESRFSVGSSSVVFPLSTFPDWTVNNVVDVALYSVPENIFSFLGDENQVSDILNVVAFVPAIEVSPFIPRSVMSRELSPMPANTYIPIDVAFDASQTTNCLNTPVDADNVCTLECRVWDPTSSAFVSTGVTTDFASINSASTSVRCGASRSSSVALFRTVRNPLILSSTGAASSSGAATGGSSDETQAVRVSVELTVSSRNGFRSDFIQDIAALTGQPESRFNVETVVPSDVKTKVVFIIWAPTTSTGATSLDVYESLRSMTLFDVLSTTYVRYADLSTWQMQCPDLVFRSECSGSSAQASWMLPVVIVASVLGLLLLCCVAAVCVRRYRTFDAKDKGVEETMPGAVGAKQFFYTPNEPENSKSSANTSDEVESDVTIVGGVAATNSNAVDDEEEISEPIVVENEAVAAALAKLPISNVRAAQRTIEEAEEEESVNSQGSLSESHFVYVDESKRDSSRSSMTDREFSRSGSSASHFRVPVTGGSASASREVSTSSRRSSNNTSMHFRYSDDRASEVSTSRTPSLPHLNEPHSPSHSSRRSQNVAFRPTSENGEQSKPTEKKAIRVVRPGQQ